MAERRMFSKTIITSDSFIDMPLTAQALYFHLALQADDDGFVSNPKGVQRITGCSEEDMKCLAQNSFIIPFDSGVLVIRHWNLHNSIQKDRYKPTTHLTEKAMLELENNKAYTRCIQNVPDLDS